MVEHSAVNFSDERLILHRLTPKLTSETGKLDPSLDPVFCNLFRAISEGFSNSRRRRFAPVEEMNRSNFASRKDAGAVRCFAVRSRTPVRHDVRFGALKQKLSATGSRPKKKELWKHLRCIDSCN